MVKSIRWNKRALDTFYETANYLEVNYSQKTAEKFVNSIFDKIDVLKKYPLIGKKAPKRKTVRFVRLDKHRRLYYRIKGQQLIVSSIFDTRQHSDKDFHQ